ncbi:ribonuclease E/G [Roseiterribacter gracilis]|uniref:Ribonuclease G Rng n=1 Tax=Roseiterribacter gracilis TaxID=2812848 RepID=A0A8S8XAN7_9PROT|nr:ribonuclease G Rng [Rhodospirillales bacterium TMPK1]
MTRELLVDVTGGRRRAALVEDGRLCAIEIDRLDRPSAVGSVHRALPDHHRPGLGQFLKLADGSRVLLSARAVGNRAGGVPEPVPNGPVTVQIKNDAVGDKAAQVSTDVSLPGRFVIALPSSDGVRFSRRFPEAGRSGLARLLLELPGGWIVRTAAASADPALVVHEARALLESWSSLVQGDEASLLLPAPSAPQRLLTETPDPIDRIELEDGAPALLAWVKTNAPDLVDRIHPYRDTTPLFALRDLDGAIDSLTEPVVTLPGGGRLTIETVTALTAIDVDGSTRNALDANLAASDEIARQLRLRHIGGLIVVDFISMRSPRDRALVERALQTALARDPVETQMLPMSKFGLVELARERRGRPIAELLA